jgi:hypothetical protein
MYALAIPFVGAFVSEVGIRIGDGIMFVVVVDIIVARRKKMASKGRHVS